MFVTSEIPQEKKKNKTVHSYLKETFICTFFLMPKKKTLTLSFVMIRETMGLL